MNVKKYKFNKLNIILDETSILKNMIFVLKSGTLISRKSAGLTSEAAMDCDTSMGQNKDMTEHSKGQNDTMLKIDATLVKEYDLVLEFASLSSAGLAKICDKSIYVEISYIDWLFEYLNEIGEQESFGGLFRRY